MNKLPVKFVLPISVFDPVVISEPDITLPLEAVTDARCA
jgi:hypothetical protein